MSYPGQPVANTDLKNLPRCASDLLMKRDSELRKHPVDTTRHPLAKNDL